MTHQTIPTRSNRFANNDILELQQANRTPIPSYKDVPLMSLEEAVESIVPFVPHVRKYAAKAKELCKENAALTPNESAAIRLYTMTTSFYEELNKALRAENPQSLVPWLGFLKLFINALEKLPSCSTTVWRGVKGDIGSNFSENTLHTWWSVNSCSPRINVAECYAGGRGSLFCINTIYGKDITAYAANTDEEEIILMPGTCLHVQSTSIRDNGYFMVQLNEYITIPPRKHVMLSYNSDNKDIVLKIHQILLDYHIPIWFDVRGDTRDNIHDNYDSLAKGVENAIVVCPLITLDYQKSDICQLELQYAQRRHKRIVPCMLVDTEISKLSDWLKMIITGLECIDFCNMSELHGNVMHLIERIKKESLESQSVRSLPDDKPSYLFELIRLEYKRNGRTEGFISLEKSFSIKESCVKLVILETKGKQERKKKLCDPHHNGVITDTSEEINDTKTQIDAKDIFEKCKGTKRVRVIGHAGIGKSTFCRYVAYRWAEGEIWSHYELVVLISLRRLTENRYPPGHNYSPIDVVKKEYFSYPALLKEDEELLTEQLCKNRVLWVLDGYDEIVQNIPTHLVNLLEQLLGKTDHILISRPCRDTLSYVTQMEIIRFRDSSICNCMKDVTIKGDETISSSSSSIEKTMKEYIHRSRWTDRIFKQPLNAREYILLAITILTLLALVLITKKLNDQPSTNINSICPPCINKMNRGIRNIPPDASWSSEVTIVAGGQGPGAALNQLHHPYGLYVDEDQTVLVADYRNHRIIEWKSGSTSGEIIAGGNGEGDQSNQLHCPTVVLVDKETNTLLICDRNNRRVVRWPRRKGTHGETVIENIPCWGLAMDDERSLYVSDHDRHEVRRYRDGEKNGIVVAGGHDRGDGPNQLNQPTYLFVDIDQSLYVSEPLNHRVTKWLKDAQKGIVIVGGLGMGNSLSQLYYPCGLFVDQLGTLYVVDSWNGRVMRWPKGATEGTVIAGGDVRIDGKNSLYRADGLFFDSENNLYVVDYLNHGVQRFSFDKTET